MKNTEYLCSDNRYRYVYQITCLKTGQVYFGQHTTRNLNDGYMGSGTRLRQIQKAFGKDQFTKRILVFAESANELNELEYKVISENMSSPLCINIAAGGTGSWNDVNSKFWTFERRSKSQKKRFQDPKQRALASERTKAAIAKMTPEQKATMRANQKMAAKKRIADPNYVPPPHASGWHQTEEAKRKISEKKRGHAPANKGTDMFFDKTTGRRVYVQEGDPIPDNCLSYLDYQQSLPAEKRTPNKRRSQHERTVAYREAYIKETQEMADYYVTHGYEATKVKYAGKSGTCSVEAMLMRFIKARKRYGIRFVSDRVHKLGHKRPHI